MTTDPQELLAQAAALIEQARGSTPQLTVDDLKTLKPEQIVAAHESGHLDHLFNESKGIEID